MRPSSPGPDVVFALRDSRSGVWVGYGEWYLTDLPYMYAMLEEPAHQQSMSQTLGDALKSPTHYCLNEQNCEILVPAYRGRGLGNLFPAVFEGFAKALGCTAITAFNIAPPGAGRNRYTRHYGGRGENCVVHFIKLRPRMQFGLWFISDTEEVL